MRKWPWLAIASGALNLALQLSGYQNPQLARVLWIVFAFAIVQWIIRHEITKEKVALARAFIKRTSKMHSFLIFVATGCGVGILGGALAWLILRMPYKSENSPPVPAHDRAHLHITGFHFTAPSDPGGHAEVRVVFINNGNLTAEVLSLGRMAFYISDTDKRSRRQFEDSLFADVPTVQPRGHPDSFILSYGTDRSVTIASSPWERSAIEAFVKGRADLYVAGKLAYVDDHGSYETTYCTYMKANGQQLFSNKHNDEP